MSNPPKTNNTKQRRLTDDEGRRSKANQRAVAGKLHPLLENTFRPVAVEDLTRITNEQLHQQLMSADWETLIAAIEQPIASMMTRAMNATGSTPEALYICLAANRAMRALEHLAANGMLMAIKQLCLTNRLAVKNLNAIALANPRHFKCMARDHVDWPVLYSPHPFFASDVQALQEELEVGADFDLALFNWTDRKRGLDLTLRQNYLAVRTIVLLHGTRSTAQPADSTAASATGSRWQEMARRLPPLTKATAKEWADVGWEAVLALYNHEPEKDAFLSPIGSAFPKKRRTPGRIRARIRSTFTDAVKNLARQP